jgi:hypothetical protein
VNETRSSDAQGKAKEKGRISHGENAAWDFGSGGQITRGTL